MKLYYIAKKTVQEVATDIVNFVVQKKPGIKLSTVGQLIVTRTPRLGANIARVVGRLLIAAGPKSGVAVRDEVTGTGQAVEKAGLNAANASSGTNDRPLGIDGAKVTQVDYQLTGEYGALGLWAIDGDWENEANAFDGALSTAASISGNTASTASGTMELFFPDFPNKDQLTIESAELRIYSEGDDTATADPQWDVTVYNDGAFLDDAVLADQHDHLSAPHTFDLMALGIDTWSELAAIRVEFTAAIGIGSTGAEWRVYEARLGVTASRTDNLT